jgi:hypothetical protein
MLGPKAIRWFTILFFLMVALRLGYKLYRTQQPSATEEQMTKAQTRVEALMKTIEADQARQHANKARVVLADSTLAATDTATAN